MASSTLFDAAVIGQQLGHEVAFALNLALQEADTNMHKQTGTG